MVIFASLRKGDGGGLEVVIVEEKMVVERNGSGSVERNGGSGGW